jgi:carnitine O-acetyltransferase
MRLTGARSLQFNIVSKGLRSDRLSYWLHEAAGEMRDLMLPTVAGATAKL